MDTSMSWFVYDKSQFWEVKQHLIFISKKKVKKKEIFIVTVIKKKQELLYNNIFKISAICEIIKSYLSSAIQ